MKMKRVDTRRMVLLAMLSGILLVMSFTPLGYLNIGPLAISLNMIPVAIGAVALGPGGGAFLGAVFGITSCLQCVGIGGTSAMGVILFEISPVLTIIQRFATRLLAGWLTGIVYRWLRKLHFPISSYGAGFCAALFNTAFFMSALPAEFNRRQKHSGIYPQFCGNQCFGGAACCHRHRRRCLQSTGKAQYDRRKIICYWQLTLVIPTL